MTKESLFSNKFNNELKSDFGSKYQIFFDK